MNTVLLPVLFLVAYVTLRFAFCGLSSQKVRVAPWLRIACAVLLVYVAAVTTLWFVSSVWGLVSVAAAAVLATSGLQGDGLTKLTQTFGKLKFLIYILSVATLAGLVYLFVPISTFLSSPGELSIHLDYLIAVNARDAMVIVYLAALAYAFAVSPRMRTALALVSIVALGLGMVYSYALPFGYPNMTGLQFEQLPISAEVRMLRTAVDAVVVICVSLALVAALQRVGAKAFVSALLLLNVSLSAAAIVSSHRDQLGTAGGDQGAAQANLHPLRFSPEHPNVLIVFLDRFMGSYVESILEDEPTLAERLAGFIWYPRTVSAGRNSIAGVHPMLGGYDYLPLEMNARRKPLKDLSVEAFSILPYNFSKKGYQVNVVSPRGLGFTVAGDCKYLQMERVTCTHIPMSAVKRKAEEMNFPLRALSESNYADLLVLLGSMRTAPYAIKHVVHERGPWRPFLDHSAGTTFTAWAELQALPELSYTKAQEPNFNIVTNLLPHEPYYIDETCKPRRDRLMRSTKEVAARGHSSLFALRHEIAAHCALLAVADYLDHLKSAGVYDNTKIVVVSDHGIVGDVRDSSTRAVAGGTEANLYVRSRSVLLVKEIGQRGALRISEAFLPNAEVPRIVCEEIGGCTNPYLNHRTIEAHGRDDPFQVSFVPWQFSAQKRDAFVIQAQLSLRGKDPFDAAGWKVEYGDPDAKSDY